MFNGEKAYAPIAGTQNLPINVPESNDKNIKMDCMLKESWWTQFIKWCVGIYIPWDACWCSHLQCLSLHASWSLHIALGYPHCWPLALNTINKLQWSSRATVRVMPAMYQTSDSPNCWRHPQQDQTWDTCQYCLRIPANCRSSWNTPEEECGTGWYAVWTPFNLVDTGNTSMNTGPVQTVGHGN